ncbi:hypothetical protein [Pantoea agglomerans]|uniref:hypothetical protein n=1 Tax=Enterobacter agglomerans TaxID=549 RepID=UPI003207E182
MEAASVLPITVTQIAPPELLIAHSGRIKNFHTTHDKYVTESADVIITDCWPARVTTELRSKLERYQVDRQLLSTCDADTVFIPCPPVTRGQEVSSEAMLDERCHVKEAKDYLLHVQNSAMEFMYQSLLSPASTPTGN